MFFDLWFTSFLIYVIFHMCLLPWQLFICDSNNSIFNEEFLKKMMDEIREQELQIVLFLKEGRGFSTVNNPLYIEASLDDRYLDTGVVPPSAEPQFGQELSWIFDRKRMRMLWTSTGHIRVNCYARIGPCKRENIGFLLLNLKYAQIQTDSRTQMTQTWRKLIGHRTPRPELLLSYYIKCATSQQHIVPNIITLAESKMLRCGGDHVDISPQLHNEQGIIQIGPESIGTDTFLLTVVIGEISNLHLTLGEGGQGSSCQLMVHVINNLIGSYRPHSWTAWHPSPRTSLPQLTSPAISTALQLLPENVGSQHGGKYEFHFCYTVCGHTINTKNITVDPTNCAIVLDNKKLVIRIHSSLSVLKTYFDSQSVLPFLMISGDEEVASTYVDLKTLVPTDSIEDLCSKYSCDNDGLVQKSRCYFASAKTQQIPFGDCGDKPSVDVILMFKLVERHIVPTVELGIDDTRTYTLLKHQSTGEIAKEGDILQQHCTYSFSAPQFMDNPQSSKHSTSSHREQSETKQSCSLDKPVKDNQETVSQEVPVTYLLLQHKSMLPSESVYSEARSASYQGKKNLSESQSQETVHSHLGFGDRNFLQPVHHLARGVVADRNDALHRYDLNITLESVQFNTVFPEMVFFKFYHPNAEVVHAKHTEVMVHSAGEDLPLRDVSCKLGIHATPGTIRHLLLASLPRVIMCSRTMGEQTLVLASTTLITSLLFYTDKRECCFSKGLRNISTREQVAIVKVSMLLEDLGVQMMSDDHARRKFAEYSEEKAVPNEIEVSKIVEELEEWKEKQQEIFKAELREKEKAHLALLMDEWYLKKSEIESALKSDYNKCSKLKEELENAQEVLRLRKEKISEREKQVELLREKMESEWTRKLQELEEIGAKMEHDVDKEMIEEKLETALKLKSFYKEQWTRVVREMLHNRDGLQISIRRSERDQLKNQGAVKILHETEAAKKEDQNILKMIKEKANKSWLNLPNHLGSSDATRGSQSESCIMSFTPKPVDKQMATDKPSPRDMEQALHGMIVERDALMRTGNYNVDDPIIAKLNQDICLLLAQLET